MNSDLDSLGLSDKVFIVSAQWRLVKPWACLGFIEAGSVACVTKTRVFVTGTANQPKGNRLTRHLLFDRESGRILDGDAGKETLASHGDRGKVLVAATEAMIDAVSRAEHAEEDAKNARRGKKSKAKEANVKTFEQIASQHAVSLHALILPDVPYVPQEAEPLPVGEMPARVSANEEALVVK